MWSRVQLSSWLVGSPWWRDSPRLDVSSAAAPPPPHCWRCARPRESPVARRVWWKTTGELCRSEMNQIKTPNGYGVKKWWSPNWSFIYWTDVHWFVSHIGGLLTLLEQCKSTSTIITRIGDNRKAKKQSKANCQHVYRTEWVAIGPNRLLHEKGECASSWQKKKRGYSTHFTAQYLADDLSQTESWVAPQLLLVHPS